MTDITIRPARRDDVPAIVALLADDPLGRTREDNADPLPDAYWRAFDEVAAQPGNLLLVAELGGSDRRLPSVDDDPRPVAARHDARAASRAVRVGAGERGPRPRRVAVRHAIGLARAEGCGLVQLTSDKSRADAHRFYERLGFVASHVGMKLELG